MLFESAFTAVALSVAQLPEEVPVPSELANVRIEVVVQATQNHFAAQNQSLVDQVLLFGNDDLGVVSAVRLGPGQQVVYPFARGTVDELLVEVVALDGDAWRNTGALSIQAVRDSWAGALWVQGSSDRSTAWTDTQVGVQHAQPLTELIPASTLQIHPTLQNYSAAPATHVPVPLPTKDKKDDDPPVVEKKRLTPV